MRGFTPDRWRTLMPALDAALAVAPADRPAWLSDLADRDPGLAADLESLLRQHANLDGERFLDPSTDVIQRILGERAPISLPFQPDDVIGTYRLMRPLGSGGMGVVWLAQQTSPMRRLVALKTARPGPLPREVAARLEAERQALAILEHPGIARVFDAGATRGGIPYFVMEYIDGAPITEYCDARRLPVDERLRLFADVCEAVDHAHGKGVLHRDLKPRNILVCEQGDRHAARIIDFGIAKSAAGALTDLTLDTQAGAVLGTPAYMSPEQAGEIEAPVDERTDVYSLGVILHELLSGAPPARSSERDEDLVPRLARGLDDRQSAGAQQIARDRASTPAALQRRLAGELQWIVGKAIRPLPADRYGSVAALRADVTHHLAGQPIAARSPSGRERLGRLVRRNRTALAAAVVLPVAVASGALVSSKRSPGPIDVGSLAVGTSAVADSMPVPLTSYPGVEADPAWSPDGRQIAFVWNGEAETDFDIYVLRAGETQPRRLTFEAGPDVILSGRRTAGGSHTTAPGAVRGSRLFTSSPLRATRTGRCSAARRPSAPRHGPTTAGA